MLSLRRRERLGGRPFLSVLCLETNCIFNKNVNIVNFHLLSEALRPCKLISHKNLCRKDGSKKKPQRNLKLIILIPCSVFANRWVMSPNESWNFNANYALQVFEESSKKLQRFLDLNQDFLLTNLFFDLLDTIFTPQTPNKFFHQVFLQFHNILKVFTNEIGYEIEPELKNPSTYA